MKSNNKDVTLEYDRLLIKFMELFEIKLQRLNYMTGSKAAYVTLIIRDPSVGNVDIASNLTTKSLIKILEFALLSAKSDIKNKTIGK